MKSQLQKTIAELVILKEFLKLELDKLLKDMDEMNNNAEYFALAHKLNDINYEILAITALIKNLMIRERGFH